MIHRSMLMMSKFRERTSAYIVCCLAATSALPGVVFAQQDAFAVPYQEFCSDCHGGRLEGTGQGTPLIGRDLTHGSTIDALRRSIEEGFPNSGMPSWSATLDAETTSRLAIYIAEQRASLSYTDFSVAAPPAIPHTVVTSDTEAFVVELFADGLDRLPYSIAPLPDGRVLVTEKTRGLRVISPEGNISALVRGTPKVFDDGAEVPVTHLVYGTGYLLDVAPHPKFASSGWIYLSFTERCTDCNTESRKNGWPVSMLKLVRGRISDGEWIDEELIWGTDLENYTAMVDMAAGGRIAFDDSGHVFLSIGMKGGSNFAGIQDLSLPYGKIVRLGENGTVPRDNPFIDVPDALPEVWTLGHRSPEGLEFNRATGQLWETEMGPRGGDEINLLLPGENYGWPLVSRGMNYDGTPVAYGHQLGISIEPETLVDPIVDLTPSPAVSSFVFYDGNAFPAWRDNMLVGTLKATELYRMVVEGTRIVRVETLLEGLGRIRDIEVDANGLVYVLLEHASGSRIVRLVPPG